VIPARAAEWKASLIVLGSSRPGSQEPARLDQVTIDIIRKAHCPVLTVPLALSGIRNVSHFIETCDGNHRVH
jgi:nucleotide-binding universal stress UspA family protein